MPWRSPPPATLAAAMAARPALDATLTAAARVAATSMSATSISAAILSAPRIKRLQHGSLWW